MKDHFRGDTAAFEKVRAMLKRGHSDKSVARYVGMPVSQIESIGRTLRLAEGEDRCHELGDPILTDEERRRRISAEQGSRALLEAIRRVA